MKIRFSLNDPPYGTERSYNGLRLAGGILASDAEGTARSGLAELTELTVAADKVIVF